MVNVFSTQPEWIGDDDRIHRPIVVPSPTKSGPSLSYKIEPEFMYHRHRVMLPPELIKDKTILDIGSCMGATGAWCLANGAKHYTGIEKLERYVKPSTALFTKYFNPTQFDIIQSDISEFETDQQYDIVVVSGMLYAVFDSFGFMEKVSKLCRETIIVDTVHPFNGYRRLYPNATDQERKDISKVISIIQPSERIRMQSVQEKVSVRVTASIVSVQALVMIMKNHNFEYNDELYSQAETEMPYYYDVEKHNRYMAKFSRTDKILTTEPTVVASQWNDTGPSIIK
jgi:2-polyprenyl-3-methyl-5-hydroxy-6-metoxy-1,4-benzoquinol methylase